MSDYVMDARTKFTPEQHRLLSAYAQVNGKDIAEVILELVVAHLDTEFHKATVLARIAAGEGTVANAGATKGAP